MKPRKINNQYATRNLVTSVHVLLTIIIAIGMTTTAHAAPLNKNHPPKLGSSGVAIQPDAIIASQYVAPDGTLQPGAAIVLSSGKIKTIRPANQYENKPNVIAYPNAVICPGLIDVRSTIGIYKNNFENAYSIDPGATIADAIDWQHRDFNQTLETGITTVMIVPSDNNLISGSSAVVKTARIDGKSIILRREGPMLFALGRSVLQFNRAPTSQIGALSMLRGVLDQAKQGQGHQRLQSFIQGKQDALIVCNEAMDISAALKTLSNYGRVVSLAYTGNEHDLVHEFSGSNRTIVIGPYAFSMPSRTLTIAAAFDQANVPVVFAAQTPVQSGDWLRITAALAVRHGLTPEKARQAITSQPARIAGVDHLVGAIKPGLDADLVVFSGDPLRLDSRVLEVYVNGIRVYRIPEIYNTTEKSSSLSNDTGAKP